jgi:L-ribulose-5-phosphate 4-epimerase
MTKDLEGVIKYQLDFESSDPVDPQWIVALEAWRSRLFALKLIGRNPALYDGYGYGNVSQRLSTGEGEFIISGSQTAHLPVLGPEQYVVVIQSFVNENRLIAKGPVKPSSEALTHSAFYHADNNINFIFHVHSAAIWNNAKQLGLPVTSPSIPYGTPEMAMEINNLFEQGALKDGNVVAMGGHQDGIIAFGNTADQAGGSIEKVLDECKV